MKKILFNKNIPWPGLFWSWLVLVIILTAMPYNPSDVVKTKDFWVRPDYLEHLSFYFILAFLFVPYYLTGKKTGNRKSLSLWTISGILFAVITEFYQLYIPNRTFNYWDLFLNIGGILSGLLFGFVLFSTRRR